MKIQKSKVEKMVITGADGLDPISVIAEDFGPGQGKITITCFGEAWSHYWSHMGDQNKLAEFFCGCDDHYLAGKLGNMREWVKDELALTSGLQSAVIKQRREGEISKERARDLWDAADAIDAFSEAEVCYQILGDDWPSLQPQKKNPDFIYLMRIVAAVKQAFTLESVAEAA